MSEESTEEEVNKFNENVKACSLEIATLVNKYAPEVQLQASSLLFEGELRIFIDKCHESKIDKISIVSTMLDDVVEGIKLEWSKKYHEDLNIKIGCECNKK